MTRFATLIALALLALWAVAPAASAVTIEQITSPAGIHAWLVREHAVPLVALNYAFHGGSSQDDPTKAGTGHLTRADISGGPVAEGGCLLTRNAAVLAHHVRQPGAR